MSDQELNNLNLSENNNRPDWLPEKFKTGADMAKSYHELEKSLGSVPEKYDFSKSKFLDANYAPFQELQDLAKSKRVPQEVMDKFQESVDKYINEFTTDDSEEIKKLGENAKERLITLNNWAKANLQKDEFYALTRSLKTADSVKALESLRNKFMSSNSNIPNGNDSNNNSVSLEDLQDELTNNLDKYKTDIKYRKDMIARMEIASKKSSGSY